MNWADALRYRCRKCGRPIVGVGDVVMQEIKFRLTREGRTMTANVTWCPAHAPAESIAEKVT